MKKFSLALGVLCVLAAVAAAQTGGAYSVGDTGPGGGTIFYVSRSGFVMADTGQTCHYLEAAPANVGSPSYWAQSISLNIGGTETAIGTGRKNTAIILNADRNAPAAKICNEYSNNGKSDWFLPSKDELAQIYANRSPVGNMGTNDFWSSSQYNNTRAWNLNFNNGNQDNSSKGTYKRVRPIRAF